MSVAQLRTSILALARHEDKVIAALREPVGVNRADAGRGAGNKGRAEGWVIWGTLSGLDIMRICA